MRPIVTVTAVSVYVTSGFDGGGGDGTSGTATRPDEGPRRPLVVMPTPT